MKNKNSIKWPRYWNNKKRTVSSDTNRVTELQSYFPSKYGALQYQTLQLPRGKYGHRRPDLLIKICGYPVPVEHDGGIHGFNDEISESDQTKERNDDYLRDGILPIIVNQEQLEHEKISEELFVKCAVILLEPIFRAKTRLILEEIKT